MVFLESSGGLTSTGSTSPSLASCWDTATLGTAGSCGLGPLLTLSLVQLQPPQLACWLLCLGRAGAGWGPAGTTSSCKWPPPGDTRVPRRTQCCDPALPTICCSSSLPPTPQPTLRPTARCWAGMGWGCPVPLPTPQAGTPQEGADRSAGIMPTGLGERCRWVCNTDADGTVVLMQNP